MFDYGMTDDPIGPSDHIRTTLDFLDNNIKMLKKLSDKVQVKFKLRFLQTSKEFLCYRNYI